MRVKTFILATSAAGALALSAGVANAEPNGWYGALDAGWHSAEVDTNRTSINALEVEDNWAGFARLGYRFDQSWRVELEGGHRAGDLGDILNTAGNVSVCNVTPAVGACNTPDGELNSTSLMVNVLYDFGTADSRLRPFVGLGAGVNRVKTEFLGTHAANRPVTVGANDTSTDLAAQGIVGLAFAFGDRGHMDLTYRYLVSNMKFDVFQSAAPAPGVHEGRYTDHSLTLGLRYAFGAAEPAYIAPPPPPPPPPAQPAAREFVVYFDWDRSDLTAEAAQVVTQAANYAKSGRATRILVVGHADTSGSAAYNIGLSNRRARTVADALVAQGVNGGVISLDGKGETALARPTADGVREPLNRRATIGINF